MRAERILFGVAVAIGLGLGAVGGAGVASAGPDEYLYDVHINGNIVGPDSELLQWGNTACSESSQGVPPGETITKIDGSTQLDNQDAQYVYEKALEHLC
jgi:hypothetical protein